MRYRLEYAPVWLLANLIRWLPRPLARGLCISVGLLIYTLHGRLRTVGMRNLDLAFPAKSKKEKQKILRTLFIGLGRQLAEFCLFPRYTRENVTSVAVYEGFENFANAHARGKGVVILTAHIGGWEVSSFCPFAVWSSHEHCGASAGQSICGSYGGALPDHARQSHVFQTGICSRADQGTEEGARLWGS